MPKSPSLHHFQCAYCGEEATISRRFAKSVKFCKICQVVRDFKLRNVKARPCRMCGLDFWPIRSSKSWDLCGRCAAPFVTIAEAKKFPVCNICDERALPAAGLDATCVSCVQSTEELRDGYVRRCKALADERRKNNLLTPSEVL
ncbi:MAG: hypothetical protein OJJ55_06645 [Rhodococcus sp.]|nr:hypothetical protein [Rhodococcus sp. (in: high G+C Gram-positive bacteria)]